MQPSQTTAETDAAARSSQIVEADLTWVHDENGGHFARDVRIEIKPDGRIGRVGDISEQPTLRLQDHAILPGFVNAHSHAFQRGLRGRGETFPDGAGSFWTWREEMYQLVGRMTREKIYDLALLAFLEMRDAGITTVGEFHYLHHDGQLPEDDTASVEENFAFDELMLRAAADAGIRINLLCAFYMTGGIDEPLRGPQRRFSTTDLDRFWQHVDNLQSLLDPATQSIGIVAHSIRAVPLEIIRELHKQSQQRSLMFHMHVEEQQREISACVDHYHQPPLALLNEHLQIDPRFTAVHCTHSANADLDEFIAAGGNVCICPLTEANLGDGLANVPRLMNQQARICLGTDSNARIDFLEEMRLLEYGQRLAGMRRGVCIDNAGRCAEPLLTIATLNGARALGLQAGTIETNHAADLLAIDLTSRSLVGWDADSLLASLIFGCDSSVISHTCVNGRWRQRCEAETESQ